MRGLRISALMASGLLLMAAAVIGCASGGGTAAPAASEPPASTEPAAASAGSANATTVIRVATPEPADDSIKAHLATTVLDTGTQRIAFLLETPKALVKAPTVEVSVTHADGAVAPAQVTAQFNEWPYGVRGSYSAAVEFPAPGEYVLTAAVSDDVNGVTGAVDIPVTARAQSPVPSVGEAAPSSITKTLGDGLELAQLTTDYEPDPELYRLSIADAVDAGRPAVIVFATPAFCSSPTCGPQVDTVSELRAKHPAAASYIHVELYDNPEEIQGDLSRARLAPAADEWGFTQIDHWTNESWVFVLDAGGVVRHRFEGFAALGELEAALGDVGGLFP